ncbi:hypothetical protein [Mucilaginibacter corticis]|uniref:hypothetical protein n=1 Tax=Mucilaginibacter corticis TaxID=2597670 RepID=UPI001642D54B|nr:hypothetical protein [Mucilaginibacter corticis]
MAVPARQAGLSVISAAQDATPIPDGLQAMQVYTSNADFRNNGGQQTVLVC